MSSEHLGLRALPRHYHSSEDFPFEKLNDSVFAFADSLLKGEGFFFTSIFLDRDENDRIYAKYRFPQKEKEEKAADTLFTDAVSFLEKARIYFHQDRQKIIKQSTNSDSESTPHNLYWEAFNIFRIYHKFYLAGNLTPEENEPLKIRLGDLAPRPIKTYFEKGMVEEVNEFRSEMQADKFVKTFQDAELIMVKKWPIDNKGGIQLNLNETYFLTVPILYRGELRGAFYFVYDVTKIREEDVSEFAIFFRPLLMYVTRMYEKIILDEEINKFPPKPQDPYLNFLTFCKRSGIVFDDFLKIEPDQGFSPQLITENEFLMDLGYDDYYRRMARVLIPEITSVLAASEKRIHNAITAIIVDSFAHNVGAHALVALKWWFENRARSYDRKFEFRKVKLAFRKLTDFLQNPKKLAFYAKKRLFHSNLEDSDSSQSNHDLSLLDIIRFMEPDLQKHFLQFIDEKTGKVVGQFPVPVDVGLYNFFQYLRDKSALWSGVARDTVFSGRIKSWESLITDFLQNTLFLGTVTHSEGINRINFHLEIRSAGKIVVGGEFAQVNLEIIRQEKAEAETDKSIQPKARKGDYSDYAFLREGKDYKELIDSIRKLDQVFLPNGVIGEHAFYTILENTLRNIKHYREGLGEIRKSGINLYLSIEEVPFVPRRPKQINWKQKPLYRVGIWLHHPQKLLNGDGCFLYEAGEKKAENRKPEEIIDAKVGAVIHAHTQQLKQRVVDRGGSARLGGSSQDKICAAMLMNNTFISINETDLDQVKRHYYPYLFAATEDWKGSSVERPVDSTPSITYFHPVCDDSLVAGNTLERNKLYKKAVRTYLDKHQAGEKGAIQKYFHLWKGEAYKLVDADFDPQSENLSRFRVIAVDTYQETDGRGNTITFTWDAEEEKKLPIWPMRQKGNIRVIQLPPPQHESDTQSQYELAMTQWLRDWVGASKEPRGVYLQMPQNNSFGHIGAIYLYEKDGHARLEYANQEDVIDRIADPTHPLTEKLLKKFQNLRLAHAPETIKEGVCRIRSHGSLVADVFKAQSFHDLADARPNFEMQAKLLETCMTQVYLFDDRLHDRVGRRKKQYDTFKKFLGLHAFSENREIFFEQLKGQIFKKKEMPPTYVVLHLSFLESIRLKKDEERTYKEQEVEKFFKEQIQARFKKIHGVPLPDNFLLIITSGRGRGDWFKAINHPQISFRPIEALAGALEDGLSLKDDFQVKYNLGNVLFGS